MKILWITNILFPEVAEKIIGEGDLRDSGGWLLASAEILTNQKEIELNIATISIFVDKFEIFKGDKITYYVIPYKKNIHKYEPYWKKIKEDVQPDVVHIHGTEYNYGLSYINACGNEHVVVSIQGLTSGISPYFCAGLSCLEIYGNLTFRDLIKGNIYKDQRRFYKNGEIEKETLRKVKHIIGRTSWDKAHVWAINPDASYYVGNETLRSTFYDGSKWEYEKSEPHSIFLSQAHYPLKGFHQVLKAMPLILQYYPDATIRIAGPDITLSKGIRGRLLLTGYGKIVKRLIKKYNLTNKVKFLGPLNATEMKNEYLRCNVFICPSSIENSPNSLGEAQILGVPCAATYAGGIPDFMRGFEEYMYRFEEIDMLANIVCRIFNSEKMAYFDNKQAIIRHDPQLNMDNLITIYKHLQNQV